MGGHVAAGVAAKRMQGLRVPARESLSQTVVCVCVCVCPPSKYLVNRQQAVIDPVGRLGINTNSPVVSLH